MRKTLFLFTLFASAVVARAQIEMPVTHPRFTLVIQPKVREHLKVTDEQYAKVKTILDGVLHDDGNGRVSIQIQGDADMEQMDKDVLKLLDDKQKIRLEELWLQRSGKIALSDKKTAEKVALTEEQSKKLDGIVSEYRQKMMDMFMTNDGGSVEVRIDQTKLEALQKSTDEKISAILTEDQNTKWKAMAGEKFDFSEH